MIKVSFFSSEGAGGPRAVPLFSPAERVLEKTGSPVLMPAVTRYIESLRPRQDAQYVLLNAMGAGEYWGSNVNGDYFPEEALVHAPDDWSGNPLLDSIKAKSWPYGYPTFYGAKPFLHHRNKDFPPHNHPSFGEVELSVWNPRMKRVELVARVDRKLCESSGGMGLWDKLRAGNLPDVSMGCKVPFDTCSICLDWNKYRKAQATFDKEKHKHPGEAVLEQHKKNPIRGLSITRKDYCEHAKNQMNKILPDGRKVFVYNDYPRFFDISFVFIGADKTAKAMMKIADGERVFWSLPSAEIAEKLGYVEGEEKTASVETDALKLAFLGKRAKDKRGEITKDVVPSQFAGKAVPVLTKNESDLPRELLNLLGKQPLDKALSTTAGLGIVLRPREFQRVVLVSMKMPATADVLEDRGAVFPRSEKETPVSLGEGSFCAALARMLLPFLDARSGFGPFIERRVVVLAGDPGETKKASSSLSSDLLHKIGAAYNGYRNGVMELVASAQGLLASAATSQEVALQKLATAPAEEIFTPLSFEYLKEGFRDEMSEVGITAQARADVERGFPSRNT